MEIIVKNLEDLKPYEKNAKRHPQKQIDLLCKNIERFGFTTPVLINEKNDVIGGHGRLLALKQMNKKEVPCVCIEGLTDAEVKALRLADNKIAEMGEDDMDLIIDELKELELAGFDIDLTGFDKNIMDLEFNFKNSELKPEEEKETNKRCPNCNYEL